MKISKYDRETDSLEDAAKRLGISRSAAYRAAHAGELPVLRFGRRLVVPRAALAQLLASGVPPTPEER